MIHRYCLGDYELDFQAANFIYVVRFRCLQVPVSGRKFTCQDKVGNGRVMVL
jgi:hypothetical protein